MPWKKRSDFKTSEEYKLFIKEKNLLSRYKISLDEWNDKLTKQNNTCGLCKEEFKKDDVLCLDHCHKTLKLRHIIHDHCNRMLGCAKDNINLLTKAIIYLTEFMNG